MSDHYIQRYSRRPLMELSFFAYVWPALRKLMISSSSFKLIAPERPEYAVTKRCPGHPVDQINVHQGIIDRACTECCTVGRIIKEHPSVPKARARESLFFRP